MHKVIRIARRKLELKHSWVVTVVSFLACGNYVGPSRGRGKSMWPFSGVVWHENINLPHTLISYSVRAG